MLSLGIRLSNVLDLIDCDTLADVGCDHGKLGAAAVLQGKAKKVIFADISEASLKKAHMLASQLNINCELRVGDGLDVLKEGEADCVVVAGMGANEIIHILEKGQHKCKSYVLVAHKDTYKLRQYLSDNCFVLSKDFVVCENDKYYDIIYAVKGEYKKLTLKQLLLGQSDKDNKYFENYLKMLKTKYVSLKNRVTDQKSKDKVADMLVAIDEAEKDYDKSE